jgi:hypothetical protein
MSTTTNIGISCHGWEDGKITIGSENLYLLDILQIYKEAAEERKANLTGIVHIDACYAESFIQRLGNYHLKNGARRKTNLQKILPTTPEREYFVILSMAAKATQKSKEGDGITAVIITTDLKCGYSREITSRTFAILNRVYRNAECVSLGPLLVIYLKFDSISVQSHISRP